MKQKDVTGNGNRMKVKEMIERKRNKMKQNEKKKEARE